MRFGIGILLIIRKVGGFQPSVDGIIPIKNATFQFVPDINDAYRLNINPIMVLQKPFVRFLGNIIDAPILSIEEQHKRSRCQRFHIQMLGHASSDVILATRAVPGAHIRLKAQMFEIVQRDGFEKPMPQSLIAIFLPGKNIHSLLTAPSRLLSVCPKPYKLIDARIVELIELNVAQAFPLTAFHKIIA